MRIFSKKSFQFDHPTSLALFVIVMAGAFADVEDWVADSPMFKLAQSDGDVEVIGSKADEKAAETGSKPQTRAEKEAEARAKKASKAALDAELADFAALSEDEQTLKLQAGEIEPADTPEERVHQYTELLQKEAAEGQQ